MDAELKAKLKFNFEDYTCEETLDGGIYGYSGIYINNKTDKKYVIRGFSENEYRIGLEDIKALAQIKYPSLLSLRGFDEESFFLLFDYLPNGSLEDYIRKKCNYLPNGSSDSREVDTCNYIIILGLSIAINYLHKHNITHYRLHPCNVLFDENFYPVLSEYLVSKETFENYWIHHTNTFPQYFYDHPDNDLVPASNAYSFSLMIYSLISHKMIFYDLRKPSPRIRIFMDTKDLRPNLSVIHNEYICNLLEKCWNKDPTQRPTFDEIIDQITNKEFYEETFSDLDHDRVKKYLDLFGSEYDYIKSKF